MENLCLRILIIFGLVLGLAGCVPPHLIGIRGSSPGKFSHPKGIDIASDGSIWVADTFNHRLQHFRSDGSFMGQIAREGSEPGQLYYPEDIAIDTDGSLWIVDAYRLHHLQPNGSLINRYGSFGSANEKFRDPHGVDIAADGSIWVADYSNHRLVHLQPNGTLIAQVGSAGSGPGQFYHPTDVSVATDGSLWVTEFGNPRIQHLQSNGTYIGQIGGLETPSNDTDISSYSPEVGIMVGMAEIKRRAGYSSVITLDDSSIWAADASSHSLKHLQSNGELIKQIGKFGYAEGQFDYPSGIAVASDGSIWATSYNERLQHFDPNGVLIKPNASK